LGKRLNNGIWPPSEKLMRVAPALLRCPLCPLPDVLPCPEARPLPSLFRALCLPTTDVISWFSIDIT
jgi:hypothetical protein